MNDSQFDTRIADIQTNLALLAASAQTRDSQLNRLTTTLEKHTEREEKLIDKIFGKLEETKISCDEKHADVDARFARQDGAIAGGKYVLWIVGALASISLFLGFKGLK